MQCILTLNKKLQIHYTSMHTYLILHYNPLVRFTTHLFTPPLFCVLVSYMNCVAYSLISKDVRIADTTNFECCTVRLG